jgi:hypothetical protein
VKPVIRLGTCWLAPEAEARPHPMPPSELSAAARPFASSRSSLLGEKLRLVKPSTSGRTITSPVSSDSAGCWKRNSISRSATLIGEYPSKPSAGCSVASETMTRSAPSARATATGMLAERPPSARN